MKSKYTTVFFDWGGVVINNPGDTFLADLIKSVGASNAQVQEILQTYTKPFMRGQISEAEYWQELRSKYGLSADHSITDEFKKWPGMVVNKDILALAKKLKTDGLNVAVLTNVIEPIYNVIEQTGYYESFDEVIASCKVGYLKPEKEIYEIGLKRFNANAEESIFIDDKQYCLNPAMAMGFETILAQSPEQIIRDVQSYLGQPA